MHALEKTSGKDFCQLLAKTCFRKSLLYARELLLLDAGHSIW